MSKTKEELTQLKMEYETICGKLKELTEAELKIVSGGSAAVLEEQTQPQDRIQEDGRSFERNPMDINTLKSQIQPRQRAKYVSTELPFRCKVCGFLSQDLTEILEHVKNVHHGDPDLIETTILG